MAVGRVWCSARRARWRGEGGGGEGGQLVLAELGRAAPLLVASRVAPACRLLRCSTPIHPLKPSSEPRSGRVREVALLPQTLPRRRSRPQAAPTEPRGRGRGGHGDGVRIWTSVEEKQQLTLKGWYEDGGEGVAASLVLPSPRLVSFASPPSPSLARLDSSRVCRACVCAVRTCPSAVDVPSQLRARPPRRLPLKLVLLASTTLPR